MTGSTKYTFLNGALFLALLLLKAPAFGQGRVVINEFMPWSGCNTTSEFIELMNFGPGPMNIGCYTVTNGKYSVTVPPNTILQRGQYFILAGQNILAQNCGNVDSAVKVDLNWTTCNCTSTPIPATGDGFLQNGGNANEKIILLDQNLKIVDAVSRDPAPTSSVSITTSNAGGLCTSHSFDLDTMAISYESINISSGVDNSYSRRVDGDCGWVKTTQISARASNKTGSTSSADYQFSTLSASECKGDMGSISISVSANDVSALFPMNYTLAFDKDSNGIIESTDLYYYGVDSSAPSIDIKDLAYGRYRITVGSASGCNLKTFDFFIFNCYGIALPVILEDFRYVGIKAQQHAFAYRVNEPRSLKKVVLEVLNNGAYTPVRSEFAPFERISGEIKAPITQLSKYRLSVVDQTNRFLYSPIVSVGATSTDLRFRFSTFEDKIYVELKQDADAVVAYTIFNAVGTLIIHGKSHYDSREKKLAISTLGLNRGIYFLKIADGGPYSFKFWKL